MRASGLYRGTLTTGKADTATFEEEKQRGPQGGFQQRLVQLQLSCTDFLSLRLHSHRPYGSVNIASAEQGRVFREPCTESEQQQVGQVPPLLGVPVFQLSAVIFNVFFDKALASDGKRSQHNLVKEMS